MQSLSAPPLIADDCPLFVLAVGIALAPLLKLGHGYGRSWLWGVIHRGSQQAGGGVVRRVLVLLMLVAFVVAVAVVPALAQGEQGCGGLRKAVEQQDTSGPNGVNEKVEAKAQDACAKVS